MNNLKEFADELNGFISKKNSFHFNEIQKILDEKIPYVLNVKRNSEGENEN